MKALKSTRSVLVTALGVSLACSLPTMVMAKVSGKVCSDCHTMHSSQENIAAPADWDLTAPRGALLANTCYGCHTGDGTTRLSGIGAPLVITTSGAAQANGILPGGFFSTTLDKQKQHTIFSLDNATTDIASPPGWDSATSPRGAAVTAAGGWAGDSLVCAGTLGCHGDYTQLDQGAAVSGIHHRATALGFRGLMGINGIESTAYEVKYNGYSAVDHPRDGDNTTISSLCAQCHSKFHDLGAATSDVLSSGAWIRHPTDFALKSANQLNDDYDGYGFGTNGYNEEVPVGYSANNIIDTYSGTAAFTNWGANPGVSVSAVICLSCHRAHGSPYADLLRWSYGTMIAGSPTATDVAVGKGCFRCHTTKDDA